MPTRTYLEMRRPADLRPSRTNAADVRIDKIERCPAAFWRFLYREVGKRYHWVDRLPWTDDEIRAYLDSPDTSLFVLNAGGAPAGYFELRRHPDGSVEIAYFGLLDDYVGRGLGGHLLTAAVEAAWTLQPSRVWLHTSTLDHPHALANYTSRGFVVTRTEDYEIPQL